MAEKGTGSAQRTRHIGIRFFLVKDRVESGEVELEYLKTTDVVADLMTKPLQGELLRKLCRMLLNWEHESASTVVYRGVSRMELPRMELPRMELPLMEMSMVMTPVKLLLLLEPLLQLACRRRYTLLPVPRYWRYGERSSC